MVMQKLALNVGKRIINRVGIMTQRQMLATTTKVGRGITEAVTKGELTVEQVDTIIKKALPKGIKAPNFITLSPKGAEDWIMNTGLVEDVSSIERTVAMAGGFNFVNPINTNSMLYLNPSLLNGNVVAHEFRHHLDNTATLKSKITSIFNKLLSKSKHVQARSKQLSQIFQNSYNLLEYTIATNSGMKKPSDLTRLFVAPTKAGLLSHLGVTEKELDSYLSRYTNNLLEMYAQSSKNNIDILKALIRAAKKEATAYHSGAKITRALGHIKKSESCHSDMTSIFHDELEKALKQKLKEERKAYYKGLIGLKTPKRQFMPIEFKSKAAIDPFIDKSIQEPVQKTVNSIQPKKVISSKTFIDKNGLKTIEEEIEL